MLRKLRATFSGLLVTLPLMAAPVAMLSWPAPALAASPAVEAVLILSRARAADRKCGYLAEDERRDLSRFAARAEIAAASQRSPQEAAKAASTGRAAGSAAACSPELEADIRETVVAAREAVAARDAEEAAPRRRALKPEAKPGEGGEAGLGFYRQVVSGYYLERQCRSLPRRDADRFWKAIVRLHRATLARNGRAAVARVMAKAEREAAASGCSRNVSARIARAYRDVSGR